MLGDFGDFSVFLRKESDDGMIKINYFDERELLVRKEIETKAPKDTKAKGTEVPTQFLIVIGTIFFITIFLINSDFTQP